MEKLRYDLHIHSRLSPCGEMEMTPNNIVGMAGVLELQMIGVADHNTAKNLPAIQTLCDEAGILLVPAIEVTTAEEVHVLSLFPDVESAMRMDAILEEGALPSVKNRPDIFGHQLIMNRDDKIIGETEKLLINATSLTIERIFALVRGFGGVPAPAHIDKNAYSIVSNLGFIPPELAVTAVEVKRPPYAGAAGYQVITDSDAHELGLMADHTAGELTVEKRSVEAVLRALRGF